MFRCLEGDTCAFLVRPRVSQKLARRVNMKRSILRALTLCLTTVCVASIARAQNDSTTQSGRSGAATTPGSSGTGIYGTQSSSSTTRAGEPVRLSKLMNANLKSQSGENLGQVQDLIVDPSNGQIQFAVLSVNSASSGSATSSGVGTTTTPGIPTPTGTSSGQQLTAIPTRPGAIHSQCGSNDVARRAHVQQQFMANHELDMDAERVFALWCHSEQHWSTG